MSPANLKDPFGPSCCEGTSGACEEALKEPQSALSCGCDPGINWLCYNHKFKSAALELVNYFRERAEDYKTDELASTIYTDAADRLEELL